MGVLPVRLAAAAVVVLATALPATAHHWFSASFDGDAPLTLTGTVARFDWKNPHVLVHVDVADASTGGGRTWIMEMGSPNGLMRAGWSRNALKVGERITVEGAPARDGTALMYPRSITLSTGKRLLPAAQVP